MFSTRGLKTDQKRSAVAKLEELETLYRKVASLGLNTGGFTVLCPF